MLVLFVPISIWGIPPVLSEWSRTVCVTVLATSAADEGVVGIVKPPDEPDTTADEPTFLTKLLKSLLLIIDIIYINFYIITHLPSIKRRAVSKDKRIITCKGNVCLYIQENSWLNFPICNSKFLSISHIVINILFVNLLFLFSLHHYKGNWAKLYLIR